MFSFIFTRNIAYDIINIETQTSKALNQQLLSTKLNQMSATLFCMIKLSFREAVIFPCFSGGINDSPEYNPSTKAYRYLEEHPNAQPSCTLILHLLLYKFYIHVVKTPFAVTEYYFFNLYDRRYSPYVFAGLAAYRFNPYAYNGTSDKIFLKPLSTEGQGIPGYPNREQYSLTQVALPFGGGIKFAISDNLRVGLEMGIRKLFTDYFDDVSTTYADPNDLLAARGQLAVDRSDRGDEVPSGSPAYPTKGDQRGGEKSKDYYYFSGLHLTYRLGAGGGGSNGGKNKTGCPVNVY